MRNGGYIRECDWSDVEVAALRDAYADASKPVQLAALALRLGRNKPDVCRKARSLGLTNQRRPKVDHPKGSKPRKYASDAERNAAISKLFKEMWAKRGHPRGALGMRHSDETKRKLSEKSKAMWADPDSRLNSEAMTQFRSDQMLKRIAAGDMAQGYSRCRGGRRNDLGDRYFRSAWEANYARYLNMLVQQGEIASWEYEPMTFEFTAIKRGIRAYTPDFKVIAHDGTHVWHEVKGWMDDKSKTRLARFERYFPNEKLIVVDGKWFKAANKTIGRMIKEWETGTVHV